ncbi:MAG: 6-phosphogluconolactonase [Patescibacteria group bacterium]
MKIFQASSREEAAAKAGKQVSLFVKQMKKNPVLLLLSGGSCLEVVDSIDPGVFGNQVTVGMLDERYSRDPSINNFAQFANRILCQEGWKRNARFIDTRVQAQIINEEEVPETFQEFAARTHNSFKKWKETNPAGRVIITQGIGEDGHTAGIMPYPENPELFARLFDDSKRWVVGYNADGKSPYPLRVTMTLPFLREIVDYSAVYVVGQSKKVVLERVLLEKTKVWEIPARIIHQIKNVFLFTDIS